MTIFILKNPHNDQIHTMIEIFNVIAIFTCFSIAVNTYEYSKNKSFIFLGITYGSTGILTAVHLVTSIGWSQLTLYQVTQSLLVVEWAHIIEGFSFLIAPLFFYRPLSICRIALFFSTLTLFILCFVFFVPSLAISSDNSKTSTLYWYNGFAVLLYLLAAIVTDWQKRHYHQKVFWLMMAFFGFKILTEFLLMQTGWYMDAFYFSAHCSNLIAYSILYHVLVVINLKDPQKLLFYRLVKAQQRTSQINKQLQSEVELHKKTTEELKQSLAELKKARSVLREREKLSIIGQMAAGMAHEIKNPLTSVRGFTQLLQKKEEADSFTQKALGTMIEEVDQACRVIDDFLQLARPKPPKLEQHNLVSIVKEVSTIVDSQAFLNKIHTEYDLSELDIICCVDKNQIKQVLLNLCKNGLESMKQKGTLTISVKRVGQDCIISVRDTGCGIAKQDLEQVGVPFYTTKDHGTGLGLSISQSIMQSHDGRLVIESKEGLGTTVHLYFPLAQNCPAAKLENVPNVVY